MKNSDFICPVCESKSANLLDEISLSDQFRHYSPDIIVQQRLLETSGLKTDRYKLYECNYCNLRYSSPMEAPGGEWYSYAYNELQIHASDRWEFEHVACHSRSIDKIGEIGCGTGIFLSRCKSMGLIARGIDFSSSSVSDCLNKGLEAEVFDIGSGVIRFHREMDVLASFHVIEHLENPNRIFEIANNWGKEQATLWIAVPSDRGIARIVNLKHIFDEPPHHLTKWDCSSLREIGKQNGWCLMDLIYDPLPWRKRLYLMTTHSSLYKEISGRIGKASGWPDRVLRYALYPWVLLANGSMVRRITGHSMLARFERA